MASTPGRAAASWGLALGLAAVVLAAAAGAQRLPIRRYTVADGLAHDRIERIRGDSRGFLWFCTYDGLSRFDGRRFTSYGFLEGLASSRVTDLLESADGAYWIATAGGGVARFEPGGSRPGSAAPRFVSLPLEGDVQASVARLFQDRGGRIWAAALSGLYRLEGEVFRPVPLDPERRVAERIEADDVAEDARGGLWVATNYGLFRRLPDGRFARIPIAAEEEDRVWAVAADGAGRVWLGHHRGLFVLAPGPAAAAGGAAPPLPQPCRDPSTGTPRLPRGPQELCRYTAADGLGAGAAVALAVDGDAVWIGTNGGGVTLFDGERFHAYGERQGVSRRVTALAVDRGDHLWIGTPELGALQVSGSGSETFLAADGLGNGDVMRIFETRGGELAVVAAQWTLSWLEDGRFRAVHPNLPPALLASSRGHWEILQDHGGEWWVATSQGLYRFPAVRRLEELAAARPRAVYTTRDGLPDNFVSRIFEDSRGDLWIGSFHPPVMLARWQRSTGRVSTYGEGDGLPLDNWTNVFAEDASGNLWLGLHNGGLARRAAGRFELFYDDDGVPAGLVQGLYRDGEGRLWVATGSGGAARVDDPAAGRPRFVSYTMRDNLASNNLRCFAEDGAGGLFVGTARGIDRLHPASGRVERASALADLPASEVTAAFRDRRGALWFGTRNGLVRLVTGRRRPAPPPEVWLRRLTIAGVERPLFELGVRAVGGLVLEPSQRRIEVEYFALDFASDRRLGFQYRFGDGQWSAVTEQRTLAASLSPGGYRIEVRAVRDDGATSPEPATLAFRILPPLWRRGWFLAALALAAAGAARLAHRLRVRRLVELERVRTRIATDLHDDIGASLSRIAILSEVVKKSLDSASGGPEARRRLDQIADSARGLIDAMSDIVWTIDPRKDRLGDLARRIRGFASDVLEPRGIRFRCDSPEEIESLRLAPEERRHLLLIAKEAIHNVVRHSRAREVAIELGVAGRELRLAIADDGVGLDPAAVPSPEARGGRGLPSLAARARELGGRLEVDSAPGRGTRLAVRVPMGRRRRQNA